MQAKIINLNFVRPSFIKSLMLVLIVITCAMIFALVANVLKVDFLHINPNRSQFSAILGIVLAVPLLFIVNFFGVLLVFAASQFCHICMVKGFLKKYGEKGLFGIILSIPLAAIITWYSFDYLTPTDFNLAINVEPEWAPYQHGLTIQRYLVILLIQSCVTFFSLSRLKLEMQERPKLNQYIFWATLFVAACSGSIFGCLR